MNAFHRATRAQVPLKIGISGPSGSGKTTAALHIARGLVGPTGRIAFLDTENGSASLYADLTPFDTLDMTPPYQVSKFLKGIDDAVAAGYNALVIDSASHEWTQILQDKEALDARGGNQWTNWASFTKQHEAFLAAIRNAPIHLVTCLRGKEKHEMAPDTKKVTKLGVGSQMRDGFEFELTVSFDLDMKHNAITSKDRTRLFDGRLEPLTEQTGRELAKWLSGGGIPEPMPSPQTVGEVFSQMTPPESTPVSAQAEAFVESVDPTPEPAPKHITQDQWQELTQWVNANGVKHSGLNAMLRAYLVGKGWLPPTAQGFNTLQASCWVQLANQIQNRSDAFLAHLASHFPQTVTEPTTPTKGRKPKAA